MHKRKLKMKATNNTLPDSRNPMTELRNAPVEDKSSQDAPGGPPPSGIPRKLYAFLASVKLALVLLIAILLSCLAGVTLLRGERAWVLIFNALWFNGLLILLVVNVAFCLFGRIWGRKLTAISFGMILFHLSFVALLGGIIYNSMFYFHGSIRLTEGEVLPSGELASYDFSDRGRFFDISRLKGETALIKMHAGYTVDGVDKKAAYEIVVGENGLEKKETIYATKHLNYKGFRYFTDKEGYSVLALLFDRQGRELYGAHVPLQSLKQKDDSYLYTTGTKDGPGLLAFPQPPGKPLLNLNVTYLPELKKERAGEAFFQIWPVLKAEEKQGEKPVAEGKAAVGSKYKSGEHQLSVQEVRYWVSMSVRYDPGQPIVLASFWAGLGGMIITFFGRMRRDRKAAVGA